mgnify:CR=1 FL=1
MKKLLEKLQIKDITIGACAGEEQWFEDPQGPELVSCNPSTGEPIAKII